MAQLIEPNDILSGGIEYTGDTRISNYENFVSYAELYAFRYNQIEAIVDQKGLKLKNQGNESKIVNFMGFNTTLNSYTHAYTDDITGIENRYSFDEGFGIKTIDVNVNTKYVPTVTIVFSDIRGSSFFNSRFLDVNNEANLKSNYGILFDFPPPTFVLVLKGVYGESTRYFLHLLKTTPKFQAESGNYEITAEFVGKTFAVLSDIKMGYLKSMYYFNNPNASSTPNAKQSVNSFFELLLRGQTFYNDINSLLKDAQTGDLNEINEEISKINDFLSVINEIEYPNTIRNIERGTGVIQGFTYSKNFVNVYTVSETEGKALSNRYFISFEVDSSNEQLVQEVTNYLSNQRNNLLNSQYKNLVEDNFESDDIFVDVRTKSFTQNTQPLVINNFNDDSVIVFYFDYTKFFNKLNDLKSNKQLQKADLQSEVSQSVDKLLKENLGFTPTIGNIFEIICDEIDFFLQQLREAGRTNSIGRSNVSNPQIQIVDQIPWPTVFKERIDSNGISRQEKVYPATKEILEEFPEFANFGEVQFVERFIKAYFKIQEREEFERNKQRLERERFLYIPTVNFEVESDERGESEFNDQDNDVTFIKKVLERYFIYTQYSYKTLLDPNGLIEQLLDNAGVDSKAENLLTFLSQADSLNIINSVFSEKTLRIIDNFINEYNDYITQNPSSNIIEYLSNPKSKFYNKEEVQKIISLPPTDEYVFRQKSIYPNRTNSNFTGLELLEEEPEIVDISTSVDDRNVQFLKKVIDGNLLSRYFKSEGERLVFLTKNNQIFFKDIEFNETKSETNINNIDSDFFLPTFGSLGNILSDSIDIKNPSNINLLGQQVAGRLETLYESLQTYNNNKTPQSINNVIKQLSDNKIAGLEKDSVINNINSRISNKFLTPAIIEAPRIFLVKIGYEISIENKYSYLSDNDKQLFIDEYTSFATTENIDILYNLLSPAFNEEDEKIDDEKLTNTTQILDLLLELKWVKNRSALTFYEKNDDTNEELIFKQFEGLSSETNIDLNDNLRINFYIKNLFTLLKNEIRNKLEKTKQKKKDFESRIQDNDLKTQLYYSFKTIYDRWIVGTGNEQTEGNCFPYSDGKRLIELFKFVDRGYNNIGFNDGQSSTAAVIDFSSLIDYSQDPDTEVYGAMSNLLSENNFEFFPLPNFVDYTNALTTFNDMFSLKTESSLNVEPAFLCMYVGGYSTSLNSGENAYEKDDGVYFDDSTRTPNDMQSDLVKVFTVSVGKQNQSIFNITEFNADEFRETGESLKLMDDIFNKFDTNLPTPKGQNLFQVYENRSYTTKLEVPLGCTQIQPCMYYQIKNLPMINGSYIILNVQHTIDAQTQQLVTRFEGTRISKFIKPIINNPITSVLGLSNELGRIAQDNPKSLQLTPSVTYIKNEPTPSIVRSNNGEFIPDTTVFSVSNPNDDVIDTNNIAVDNVNSQNR